MRSTYSGYEQNLMARIEKLMFRDPSKMTILRHLNLAGAKVKSTLRLNLRRPPLVAAGMGCEALSNVIAECVCLFRIFFQARFFQGA